MGFENFGLVPEKIIDPELSQSLRDLAGSVRELDPADRAVFEALNSAANSHLEQMG